MVDYRAYAVEWLAMDARRSAEIYARLKEENRASKAAARERINKLREENEQWFVFDFSLLNEKKYWLKENSHRYLANGVLKILRDERALSFLILHNRSYDSWPNVFSHKVVVLLVPLHIIFAIPEKSIKLKNEYESSKINCFSQH